MPRYTPWSPANALARLLALLVLATALPAILLAASPAMAYPSQVAEILRNAGQSGSVQPSSLDAGVKDQIRAIAKDTAARTGAKVYVVVLKEADDPAQFAALYDDLRMSGKDLLIVTNGPKWELRANAIRAEVKERILKNGMTSGKPVLERLRQVAQESGSAITNAQATRMSWNEFQHANAGRGWTSGQMSANYDRYKSGQSFENTGSSGAIVPSTSASTQVPAATTAPASSGGHGGLIFLIVVAIGIAGWVFWRRRQRDQGLGEELKKALAAPEATMADVWMGLDESHPRYSALVDEATAVDAAVKDIKAAPPTRENIARLRSLTERAQQLRIAVDRK